MFQRHLNFSLNPTVGTAPAHMTALIITMISIPRIAHIPIYIADSAVQFNGESPLVGGNVRPDAPSNVDPLPLGVGLGLGCFVQEANSLWVLD